MNPAVLLLADPSPCLRRLTLTELLGLPSEHPEVAEMTRAREDDPLVTEIVGGRQPDGALRWPTGVGQWASDPMRGTSLALTRLGYLGFATDCEVVRRAADYLFSRQQPDGGWQPVVETEDGEEPECYTMRPLQTAIPLRGLAACGYATDARCERGYEWLAERRLPDGAWPTGVVGGTYGRVGGYRRLAHSRWGCRSNTLSAALCFALHPERRHSEVARRAFDLLLGCETQDAYALGHEMARLVGAEPARGLLTHHARNDSGVMLGLCARVGASTEDPRVSDLVAFVQSTRGEAGLWHYAARPQASRWVSLDLLRSLRAIGEGDWVGVEPRTPFQPYPAARRRY